VASGGALRARGVPAVAGRGGLQAARRGSLGRAELEPDSRDVGRLRRPAREGAGGRLCVVRHGLPRLAFLGGPRVWPSRRGATMDRSLHIGHLGWTGGP
jgi:hypothetical protein